MTISSPALQPLFPSADMLAQNGLARYIRTRSPLWNTALQPHLGLVERRASGADPTPARRWRRFFTTHSSYRADSRVTFEMYRDLLATLP